MKRLSSAGILLGILVVAVACQSQGQGGQKTSKANLQLENFDGGFFSIEKPSGWNVVTAGNCATLAFLIRDPAQPLRQIFYFGEVGPVYMVAQQKQIDYQYMAMGGYPVTWFEMPVVEPLTPSNFLIQFHQIAQTQSVRNFMPQCPRLENIEIISAAPQRSPIAGGSTELVRALFRDGGELGEGLFLVTVAPGPPFTGAPSAGIGYAFLFTGISAPQREFGDMESQLTQSIESFTINQAYANDCLRQQADTYAGIMKAGKTLSETSDIIMQGWESRNRTDDIIAEKRSDAILGRERLYDPETKEVYEFENGFYDRYRLESNRYEMSNLQPLPENDHELWTKAPLDGPRHLK